MDQWMTEAVRLTLHRAPLLTDEHAQDIADDLRRAWPERSPAEAVAWFFAFMPQGWNGTEQVIELAA